MSKDSTSSALSPEYVLPDFLRQRPASGPELHERIQHELGQIWQIGLSQTWNILARLEAKGFISGAAQEPEKAPVRRHFRLTPAGRRRFREWLVTPAEPRAHAIRVEFLTRLYFTYPANPRAALSLINTQIAVTEAGLAQLAEVLANLPPEQTFNRLGLDLRLRQLTSMAGWLAEYRASLELDS